MSRRCPPPAPPADLMAGVAAVPLTAASCLPTADGVLQPLALSIRQACAVAGVSRSTLYEEIAAGRLKSVRIGARRLILVEDLRDWLRAHREDGPSSAPASNKTAALSAGGARPARVDRAAR
jgi:excisionase family DNA binding protein